MEQYEKNFIVENIFQLTEKGRPLCLRAYADISGKPDHFNGQVLALLDGQEKITIIGDYAACCGIDISNYTVVKWPLKTFLEEVLEDVDLEDLYLEILEHEDFNIAVEDILKEAGVEGSSRDLEPMFKVFKLLKDEDLQQDYKFYKPFKERRVLFRVGLLEEEDFE